LDAEKVPVTERPPVAEEKVKQHGLAEEFVQDLREVRCLSIGVFLRLVLPPAKQLAVTINTT
jgi:hypothetical protein